MERRFFLQVLSSVLVAPTALTLAKPITHPSPYEQVQYRRLTYSVISKTLQEIYSSLTTFEVNDEITRQILREATAEYMDDLEDRNIIYQWTSVCDETNNPISVVNSGYIGYDVWWQYPSANTYIHFSVKPT